MATTSGVSVRGLQLLGAFNSTGDAWQLRFPSADNRPRLERFGTALVCSTASNNRFPVVAVYKLFGGGLQPEALNVSSYAGFTLWVNWFESDVTWFFERPDV